MVTRLIKKISDVTDDIGISCKTEAEAKRIFEELHLAGYKWSSGDSLIRLGTKWDKYKENTVYFLDPSDKTIIYTDTIDPSEGVIPSTQIDGTEPISAKSSYSIGDYIQLATHRSGYIVGFGSTPSRAFLIFDPSETDGHSGNGFEIFDNEDKIISVPAKYQDNCWWVEKTVTTHYKINSTGWWNTLRGRTIRIIHTRGASWIFKGETYKVQTINGNSNPHVGGQYWSCVPEDFEILPDSTKVTSEPVSVAPSIPYLRFKTQAEFEAEFGSDWRNKVKFSWAPMMNQFFGQTITQSFTGSSIVVDSFTISKDMVTDKPFPDPTSEADVTTATPKITPVSTEKTLKDIPVSEWQMYDILVCDSEEYSLIKNTNGRIIAEALNGRGVGSTGDYPVKEGEYTWQTPQRTYYHLDCDRFKLVKQRYGVPINNPIPNESEWQDLKFIPSTPIGHVWEDKKGRRYCFAGMWEGYPRLEALFDIQPYDSLPIPKDCYKYRFKGKMLALKDSLVMQFKATDEFEPAPISSVAPKVRDTEKPGKDPVSFRGRTSKSIDTKGFKIGDHVHDSEYNVSGFIQAFLASDYAVILRDDKSGHHSKGTTWYDEGGNNITHRRDSSCKGYWNCHLSNIKHEEIPETFYFEMRATSCSSPAAVVTSESAYFVGGVDPYQHEPHLERFEESIKEVEPFEIPPLISGWD